MGSKRSYDGDEPLQLPYKYSKQCASDEKLNSFTNEKMAPVASNLPCNESHVGHNDQKAPQLVDTINVKNDNEVQTVSHKGHHRFEWIKDSHDDDCGWYREIHRSLSPEYFESNFPRVPVCVGDALPSFLDRYPRKLVPIGANYQAELPEWEPPPNSDPFLISNDENKFMGNCVIPMPDFSLPDQSGIHAGAGRKDCDCNDKGSVRCVRQHVKAARDELFITFGEDKFRELGFVDMGEDISHKWSEEEEQVFHEVVFSNPASLGKDFWPCLSEVFPSRSKADIVSYYFNVFMLRKRAAQNRSRFLDIDSDDDEWHPGHGRSNDNGFVGEDGDSMWVIHDDDSSDEDDDSDDDNSGGDEGTGSAAAYNEKPPQPNMGFPYKENGFLPGNLEDSCISFEYQSGINGSAPTETDSTPTETGVPVKQNNGLKNGKSSDADQTETGDGLNPGCLDDSNHFRQWDQGFSAGLDHLLPTWNMFEEIFGPGSWDDKPAHD
uniref:Myb-like domain-containing protein n=1 Tax=Kalanchoe fedtschenkoi TaxID=63787 RepID=A0A7N0UJA8_KALFE